MLYIICVLLSFLIILNPKHKRAFGVVLLIILWIIGGLNTQRPDYQVYYDFFQYHSVNLGSIREPGYLLLNTICYDIGMNYTVFFALQVALSLVLLYKTISFFTKDATSVLLLYMLFPFAINVVQIRFFLAMSLDLYGMIFLYKYYKNGAKIDLIVYILFTFLGGLLHFATLFFFICLVPILFRKTKMRWIYFLGVIFGLLLSNVDMLFEIALPVVGVRKTTEWLSEAEAFSLLHIMMILAIRAGIIIVVIACRHGEKSKEMLSKNYAVVTDESDQINDFLYKIIIFLVISIVPLELFIQQYDRYTRFYIVLYYILVVRLLPRVNFNSRIIIILMLSIVEVLLCYYEYSRGAASSSAFWDTVVRQLFEHNLLFKR